MIYRHRTHLCLAWRWSFVLWWEGDRCHASCICSLHELSRRFCCVVNASCCSEWSNSHINKRTTSSSAWLLTRSWVHTEHNSKECYYKFSSSQTKLTKCKYKGISAAHESSSQQTSYPVNQVWRLAASHHISYTSISHLNQVLRAGITLATRL